MNFFLGKSHKEVSSSKSLLPTKDILEGLKHYTALPHQERMGKRTGLSSENFTHITELLRHLEKRDTGTHGWSLRPRIFTILWNIGRCADMKNFMAECHNDISLPYTFTTFPMGFDDAKARQDFLDVQDYVLTDARNLELSESSHLLINGSADEHFYGMRRLGRGGTGRVDCVWSRLSYKQYARKRFFKGRDTAQNRANQQMIIREVEILKRISGHSRAHHLIKLRGSYTDEKCIGFLMEPVADVDLSQYLSRVSPNGSTFEEDRTFLRSSYGCLASAIQFLHRKHVRHRDLKPQNILVHSGRLYIADFGGALDWSRKDKSTTRDQIIHVTDFYRAPECSQGMSRNSKTDMWSLGVVFLEMATVLRGKKPDHFFSHFALFPKKDPYPHANTKALTSWYEVLEQKGEGSACELEALVWIKDLLRPRANQRHSASGLLRHIMESPSSNEFCGFCCSHEIDESDGDASSSGSQDSKELNLEEIPQESMRQSIAQLLDEDQHVSAQDKGKEFSIARWIDANAAVGLEGTTIEPDHLSTQSAPLASTELDSQEFGTRKPNVQNEPALYEVVEESSSEEGSDAQAKELYQVVEDSSGSDSTLQPPGADSARPTTIQVSHAQQNGSLEQCNTVYENDDQRLDMEWTRSELESLKEDRNDDEPEKIVENGHTNGPLHFAENDQAAPNAGLKFHSPPSSPVNQVSKKAEESKETQQSKNGKTKSARLNLPPLSKLNLEKQTKSDQTSPRKRPEFSPSAYMAEAWEAASTVPTSVMSSKTTKLFRSGILIKWQDSSCDYLGEYSRKGKAAAVRWLLEKGCDPNNPHKHGSPPLIKAIQGASQRHNKCVRALLEAGAAINVKWKSKTALHWAIGLPNFKGFTNLVRELIQSGADPNALDQNRDRPIMQLLQTEGRRPLEKHRRDTLALLLQSRVDAKINITTPGSRYTPLHYAVSTRDYWAVGMLLQVGANVNAVNAAGYTPLLLAASQWKKSLQVNQREVLEFLLCEDYGVKVDAEGGENKRTALHHAAGAGIHDAVDMLLECGADPDKKDMEGKTPLQLAKAAMNKIYSYEHEKLVNSLRRNSKPKD